MKKFGNLAFLSICLILIFLLSGCLFLPSEDEVLQPPLRAPDRIEYRLIEVTRGDLAEEVRGFGTVVTRIGATVTFGNTTGRLKALHATNGQDVTEGDLLAELHNDDLLEHLERQEKYTRLAEIEYEKIRRTLWGLDREAAEIRLALAHMDLERAQEAVERTMVYAPMSGRIVFTTSIRINDYVNAFVPLYNIADINELSLVLSDEFAVSVPLGATVSMNLDNTTHYGTVVQVPSMNPIDAHDRNIAIVDFQTIEFDQNRLGSNIMIVYERARVDDAIIVERSMVRFNAGRAYVLVLEDNIPMERDVTIGLSTISQVEILEGISVGEMLVQ